MKLRWRGRLLLILALGAASVSASAADSSAKDRPALWAVYYAWDETASGPHGRWTHWSEDRTLAPNPKPKSKAQPLIGYYDSDDPVVVRWHIRLAKAAGIDAFLSSWWGAGSRSGVAFEQVILPLAAEEGFRVAL